MKWLTFCLTVAILLPAELSAYVSRVSATCSELKYIEGALITCQLETRRYPSQAEGLDVLTNDYLTEIRPDAWGRPFVYVVPGRHQPRSFDLYSLGADGKSATGGNDPDDINLWDQEKWSAYYLQKSREERRRQFRKRVTVAGAVVFVVLGCIITRRYTRKSSV